MSRARLILRRVCFSPAGPAPWRLLLAGGAGRLASPFRRVRVVTNRRLGTDAGACRRGAAPYRHRQHSLSSRLRSSLDAALSFGARRFALARRTEAARARGPLALGWARVREVSTSLALFAAYRPWDIAAVARRRLSVRRSPRDAA